MSERLKKLIASAVFLLLMFTQPTDYKDLFPEPISLSDQSIVQGIGSDDGKTNEETIKLTIASKAISPSGGDNSSGGGGEENKSIINSQSGRTFRETVDKMQASSDKTLLLNHTQVVVIGENAAKRDLLSHIEYLYTSPKMRMDLLIYVAKGHTAEEIFDINTIGSETISEKLVSLIKSEENNSYTNKTTFYDIVSKMDDLHQYVCIPSVRIIQNSTDKEKKDVQLDGYAVFYGKGLLCYIDNSQSRALNILKSDFKQSPFIIEDDSFGIVTIEAFNIKTDIKYIPDDSIGNFEVEVNVRSNFVEQYKSSEDTESPFNSQSVTKLQESLNKEIKREIDSFITFTKKQKHDIAEFSSIVKNKEPKKWKELESDWNNTFVQIPVNVTVKSHISNFFTLHDQIGVES